MDTKCMQQSIQKRKLKDRNTETNNCHFISRISFTKTDNREIFKQYNFNVAAASNMLKQIQLFSVTHQVVHTLYCKATQWLLMSLFVVTVMQLASLTYLNATFQLASKTVLSNKKLKLLNMSLLFSKLVHTTGNITCCHFYGPFLTYLCWLCQS